MAYFGLGYWLFGKVRPFPEDVNVDCYGETLFMAAVLTN